MEKKKQHQHRITTLQIIVFALAVLPLISVVRSDGSDHKYKAKDQVPLYANKVGPFQNPR